jgi:hypothetical protein
MRVCRLSFAAIAAVLPLLLNAVAFADAITTAEQQTILELHNKHRAQHCVPPLAWSAELAAAAQRYAEKCWITHDSSKPRGIGENLAWGGNRTASSAVESWYKEVSSYPFDRPRFVSGTGHFTQMIWRDAKQVGCGAAKCYFGAVRFWVCRYTPQGNWDGKFAENVPRQCK